MQCEEKYKLTRKCLEIIAGFKFPVHCVTKSTLILRDLDLLKKIDDHAILPDDLNRLNHGTLHYLYQPWMRKLQRSLSRELPVQWID